MKKKRLDLNTPKRIYKYINRKLSYIKEELNEDNPIEGTKLELFSYSDTEIELRKDVDFNEILYTFFTNQMQLADDSFNIIYAKDEMYNYLTYLIKRKCRKRLKEFNGGLEISKTEYDYNLKAWTVVKKKSVLKKGEFYNSRQEVNMILKLMLIKYN